MEVEHEVKKRAWDDCGSSLYDSFELRSFMLHLDSAIAARCISMPHCSAATAAATATSRRKPCRFVRSVRKLVRSVLRRHRCMFCVRVQSQDRAVVGGGAFSRSGRLEPIPEAISDLGSVASSSPGIDCVGAAVRKAASERFAGGRWPCNR